MQIDIRLSQEAVEANIKFVGPSGQVVKVSKILVEPIFHESKQRVPLLYATTTIAGDKDGETVELQRFVVTISGSSGKANLVDRSKQVLAQVEKDRTPKVVAGPAPPLEEDDPEEPEEDELEEEEREEQELQEELEEQEREEQELEEEYEEEDAGDEDLIEMPGASSPLA